MLPHASSILKPVRAARAASGHLFVGLDYDGTLTGIVAQPEDAHLPEAARAVLERLAARPDTRLAILSGRSLEDVRERVGVDGAYYAGNHGLEIEGPGVHRTHPEAAATIPVMQRLAAALQRTVGQVPGVIVEEKGISLSVHYRAAAEEDHDKVRDLTFWIAGAEDRVRLTEGKRVVEVRPDVDWHKGTALRFLRGTLPDPDAPALFIGDDLTDEDAFRALPPEDWGIIVAQRVLRPTAARAVLVSPEEVVAWLAALGD